MITTTTAPCAPTFNGATYDVELNFGKLLDKHPELKIDHRTFNYAVAAPMGDKTPAAEALDLYRNYDGMGKPAHVYFHVPLCNYICHYCNYVKKLLPETDAKTATLKYWTDTLMDESSRYLDLAPWLRTAPIESLYLGGGTAALLLQDRQLERLVEHIFSRYRIVEGCEMSLEGNPDNFTGRQVEYARQLGFNRFSLGIQSFQQEVNDFSNRRHTVEESLEAIANLRATGRPFNADMMFGLPYQTPETVEKDVRMLVDQGVPSITIYRFRNADRQKLGLGNKSAWNLPKVSVKIENQHLFPDVYEVYEMRARALKVMIDADYHPSPCGWWVKRGTYPGGNIPQLSRNKWQKQDSMIAFGPGAYGWLTGGNRHTIQTHNVPSIADYQRHMETSSTPPLDYAKVLEGPQAVASAFGFAFQANQPIELARFTRQFGVNLLHDEPYATVIRRLLDNGLLHMLDDGRHVMPTLEGEALHSEIIDVEIFGNIGGFSSQMCQKLGL